MGAVKKYPYPKFVWSPTGGWWCNPRNWKRNTAFGFMAAFLTSIPIVWFELKHQQRFNKYDPPRRTSWIDDLVKKVQARE